MSVIGSNILAGASGQGGGYNLTRSLRLRSSASAYLNRTPASSPTSSRLCTFSWWAKIANMGTAQKNFIGSGAFKDGIQLAFNNNIDIYFDNGNSYRTTTSAVFRDPSAWYHFVVAIDTTQATAANRVKIYVNGVQQTSTSGTMIPQNYDFNFNSSGNNHRIGTDSYNGYYDGYMAEFYDIDGQALTPSSFGETSPTTGVWQPKKYAGTYGTNGFYLPFSDNTSTTTLGADSSGNGNNWTTNNISLTAGATYDSMTDVPTLTSATAANFCTLNPLSTSSYVTISGGNLNTTGNTSADEGVCGSTFMVKTGKWYTEFTVTGSIVSNRPNYGIIPNPNANFANGGGQFANTGGMRYGPDGKVYTSGSLVGTFSTFTTGDVIGIAIDADNGAAYVSKNGTWQNSGVPTSGSSKTGAVVTWTGGTVDYFVCVDEYNGTTSATNFGQRPFAYTPPTGFVALNTFNLPTPTIGATASTQANKYMDATLYTGNGSTQSIVNAAGFSPDLVWVKQRNGTGWNILTDSVRGANKQLYTNATNSEGSDTSMITALNSNGFSVAYNGGTDVNGSGSSYVAWQWDANGTGVSNTAGSITSTVSANTTSGFSIVTYTAPATNTFTVGHGLGVAPKMILVKGRNQAYNWDVYHASLGATGRLILNSTAAFATTSGPWANTEPTSTVFSSSGNSVFYDAGDTLVAYCFSEVAGFSKFGSYTGNGSSDGTFVYTGFRPRWVLFKCSSTSGGYWVIIDAARNTYNLANLQLFPNAADADTTGGSTDQPIDILSNGFKLRGTGGAGNLSGETYIYMAFAENPFKYSLAR